MRRVILPIMALLLAGAATFAARGWLERDEPARTAAEPVKPEAAKAVLVAATDLAVGSFVQAESLRWQEWPDVVVPPSYLVRGQADESSLAGAVVRQPLTAGEPVTAPAIVKPGDRGFLAAVLEPGMRAISVPIDEAAGNAGLVLPGDRVDLILTQTVNVDNDPAGARRVSETVLEDLRVIAMGRRLTSGEGEEGQASRTATLEAPPAAVERIALAGELGKLALSLRSLAAAGDAGADERARRFTWDTEASPALRPENQQRTTLSVMRGDKLETVTIRRGAGS